MYTTDTQSQYLWQNSNGPRSNKLFWNLLKFNIPVETTQKTSAW